MSTATGAGSPAGQGTGKGTVVALVKPTPLETPRVGKGGIVTEGIAWGLAASERAVVAQAAALAQASDAELVAVALGSADMDPGLREALALGARRALRIEPDEGTMPDATATAAALAKAAQRFPGPLMVVAGEASADLGQGLTGPLVAAHLGVASLAGVHGIEAVAGQGVVAAVEDGDEVARWKLTAPFVVSVAARGIQAAHPTSWGVGEAFALPLEVVPLADLGLDGAAAAPRVQVTSLRRAEARKERAEVHEGDAEEQAAQLHRRLRAQGVVR